MIFDRLFKKRIGKDFRKMWWIHILKYVGRFEWKNTVWLICKSRGKVVYRTWKRISFRSVYNGNWKHVFKTFENLVFYFLSKNNYREDLRDDKKGWVFGDVVLRQVPKIEKIRLTRYNEYVTVKIRTFINCKSLEFNFAASS